MRFMEDALKDELAYSNVFHPFESPVWTANGDTRCDPDGTIHHQAGIERMMPIDCESPHAMTLNIEGESGVEPVPRDPLNGHGRQLVFRRLVGARDGIRKTDPSVLHFVAKFTKVLVLLRDPAAPASFSSGSSGQYVGRSYLANADLDIVDEALIADAIVHEAIHSLLYMQEQKKAWVHDLSLYGPAIRTVSPWTGNKLPLRPYMQAAFVWYGLLQFWTRAMAAKSFPLHRVREQIGLAARADFSVPDYLTRFRRFFIP